MPTIVNKANVVIVGAASSLSMVVLTDGNSPSGVALGGDPALTVADSASLSGGTQTINLGRVGLAPQPAVRNRQQKIFAMREYRLARRAEQHPMRSDHDLKRRCLQRTARRLQ
jgi:hypothetical protein